MPSIEPQTADLLSMVCQGCRMGLLLFVQTGSVRHPHARIYRCNCCGGTVAIDPVDAFLDHTEKHGLLSERKLQMATTGFQGKRVELVPQPGGFQLLKPGEYGKWTDGKWFGCTPNDHGCNLSSHQVTEHEDGTITVSPSIGVSEAAGGAPWLWHGFLERGVWREC